jgi:AbrB family looped-hinge helix DNA binding protein
MKTRWPVKATVAERGQVTIPKPLRDKLGIRPGTKLDFSDERGKLVAVKVSSADPVARVYGCLGAVIHTDRVLRELRGEK